MMALSANAIRWLAFFAACRECSFGSPGNTSAMFTTDLIQELIEAGMVENAHRYEFDRTFYRITDKGRAVWDGIYQRRTQITANVGDRVVAIVDVNPKTALVSYDVCQKGDVGTIVEFPYFGVVGLALVEWDSPREANDFPMYLDTEVQVSKQPYTRDVLEHMAYPDLHKLYWDMVSKHNLDGPYDCNGPARPYCIDQIIKMQRMEAQANE